MKKHNIKALGRRGLSLLLALVMCLGLMNVGVFAGETAGPEYVCGKTEHTHTDACYSVETGTELTCGKEETEGHTHTADCGAETVRELTCGLEEGEGHTHTDDCYVTEEVLDCDIPEGHTHTLDCYVLADENGMGGFEEQIDGEWYLVEKCICDIPENHTHGDECYTEEKTLTCEIPEAEGHTHTDACYTETTVYGCGQEEAEPHTHTETCYQRPLICGIPEHTHSEACYAVVEPEPKPEVETDETVQAVVDMFSALTEDDVNGYSEAYTAARDAYFALSEEQQAQVMEILGEENVRAILLGEAMNSAGGVVSKTPYSHYDFPDGTNPLTHLPKESEFSYTREGSDPYTFLVARGLLTLQKFYIVSPHNLYSPNNKTYGTSVGLYNVLNCDSGTYDKAYCSDVETLTYGGGAHPYRRDNIEKSWWWDHGANANKTDEERQAIADQLRAILENSYPYKGYETVLQEMKNANVDLWGNVDLGQIISATQAAVWHIANGEQRDYQYTVHDTLTNADSSRSTVRFKYGVKSDHSDAQYQWDGTNVGHNISAIQTYLETRTASVRTPEQYVISDMTVNIVDGTVFVYLNADLSSGSNVTVKLTRNGNVVGSKNLTSGNVAEFTNVTVKADDTFTATISGTQYVGRYVYYYTPKNYVSGSSKTSQALIGIGDGMTSISDSATVTVGGRPLTLNLNKQGKNGEAVTGGLAGAEFDLYRKTTGGDVKIGSSYKSDESGNVSVTVYLDSEDTATTSDFYFKETKAPDGYTIDNDGALSPGSTVYNTRQTGSLTVKKTVIYDQTKSQAPTDGKSFNIQVQLGSGSDNYGNSNTYNGPGIYSFNLTDGVPATISNIPVGTQYVVTETTENGGGYTYTSGNVTAGENKTITTAGASVTIVNTYFKAKDITWTPQVQKTVKGTGYDSNQQFTFTLTETDSNWAAKEDGATQTVTATANQTKSFGSISYTAEGTHYYTVKETAGNVFGFDYDTTVHHITVVIGTAADGTLTRTVTVDGESKGNEPITTVAFTNDYYVTGTSWAPKVQKTVVTADRGVADPKLAERNFTFTLSCDETDGVTLPADTTVTISGRDLATPKAFGSVTFTKAGTYIFTITETGIGDSHYTPDNVAKTITVTVVQDGAHDLKVESATTSGVASFINTFSFGAVNVSAKVKKEINGDTPKDPVDFTFLIEKETPDKDDPNWSGVTMPEDCEVTVHGASEGTFHPIHFTKAGTYTFRISEVAPTDKTDYQGYIFDTAKWRLKVVVEKDEGPDDVDGIAALNATCSIEKITETNSILSRIARLFKDRDVTVGPNATVTFTNTYQKTTWVPSVQKNVNTTTNAPATEDTFTFTLTNTTENKANVVGKDGQDNQTVTVTGAGKGTFAGYTFYAPGEYTFEIKETKGGLKYTYDESTWTATVKVDTDSNKKLTTSVTYKKGGEVTEVEDDTVSFTNTKLTDITLNLIKYAKVNGVETTVPVAEAHFKLVKEVSKKTSGPKDKYTARAYEDVAKYLDLVTDADGKLSVTLEDIPCVDADKYYFVETKAPDGFRLDATPIPANSEVVDWTYNYTGYNEGSDKTQEDGYINVSIYKVELNDELRTLSGAEFTLYVQEGPDKWQTIGSYTSDVEGKLNLKRLAPATYKLEETKVPDGYVIAEGETVEMIFTVETDGSITPDGGTNTLWVKHESTDAIANKGGRGSITIQKNTENDGIYEGEDIVKETFTFHLRGVRFNGDAIDIEDPDRTVEYNGTVTFDDLPYGIYYVSEKVHDIPGYKFGGVTFTNKSNNNETSGKFENGTQEFRVELNSATEQNIEVQLEATNEYTRKLVPLSITKTVINNNGDLERPWNFDLTLTAPDGYELKDFYNYTITSPDMVNEDGSTTPVPDVTGKLVPKPVVTENADGTTSTTTTWVPANENGQTADHITLRHGQTIKIENLYAGTTYSVTEVEANVSSYRTNYTNGNGAISDEGATVIVENRWSPGSSNREATNAVTWELNGTKLLDSAPAEGERFTFTVDWTFTAENGTVTSGSYERRNNGGNIPLVDTQTYDTPEEVGTYVYTISEKAENDDGIIYDDVVYTVTVKVTSSTSTTGNLTTTTYARDVTMVDDSGDVVSSIVFNNATDTTTIPDDDIPLEEFPDDDIPLADLPDDDVPMSDIPWQEELEELPEPDVPLANVPTTGDTSMMWLLASAASAAGLIWLAITGRKKEDDAE